MPEIKNVSGEDLIVPALGFGGRVVKAGETVEVTRDQLVGFYGQDRWELPADYKPRNMFEDGTFNDDEPDDPPEESADQQDGGNDNGEGSTP